MRCKIECISTLSHSYNENILARYVENLVLAKNLDQKYSIPFALQDVCFGIQFWLNWGWTQTRFPPHAITPNLCTRQKEQKLGSSTLTIYSAPPPCLLLPSSSIMLRVAYLNYMFWDVWWKFTSFPSQLDVQTPSSLFPSPKQPKMEKNCLAYVFVAFDHDGFSRLCFWQSIYCIRPTAKSNVFVYWLWP